MISRFLIFIFFISNFSKAAIVLKNTNLWDNCRGKTRVADCTIRIYFDPKLPRFKRTKREFQEVLLDILKYANIFITITEDKNRAEIIVKEVFSFSHGELGEVNKKKPFTLALSRVHFHGYTFDYFEDFRGTVLHEMLHFLGFSHEHLHEERWIKLTRFNADIYCDDQYGSVEGKKFTNSDCLDQVYFPISRGRTKYMSDYDFFSIMHYDFPTGYEIFDRRGRKIDHRDYDWGNRYHYTKRTVLSLQDKIALATLYPGRVEIQNIINYLHQEDVNREEKRFRASLFYGPCEVRKKKDATLSQYWVIEKNGKKIPETVSSINPRTGKPTAYWTYSQFNASQAVKKMRGARSCQSS